MQVVETRVYRGPNLYGYGPMIRMTLDLEELEEYPSNRLPGFTDQLIQLVPTLHEHGCSYGRPGGFISRLREGTWMGHILLNILRWSCNAWRVRR